MRSFVTTLFEVAGLVFVVAGGFMVSVAAGLIVGGVVLVTVGVLVAD